MHREQKEAAALDEISAEVKKLEEEAEAIIISAEKRKQEIISTARSEAVALLAKRQSELEKKKEERIRQQRLKIDQEKAQVAEQGRRDIAKLGAGGRKNISGAVSAVMKRLEEKIGEF